VTNVSRVGPFNASSVRVLPESDPTYVAYRGRRPGALSVLYGSPADKGAEDSWERSIWQFVVLPEARWWEPAVRELK